MTLPRVVFASAALLSLTSGCMAGPGSHLENQFDEVLSHSEIGDRPIVRLAVAPPSRDSRHGPDEHEVLKKWAMQTETDELVKSAIVLSPTIYDACKNEASTARGLPLLRRETPATECELREAVRAAADAAADTLVFARTGYYVPLTKLATLLIPIPIPFPFIPHKPAEVVTLGALYAIDAGSASMLRYERASVNLSGTRLSEQRVRSIEGFLKAVSNSLVENADEFRYLHGSKMADARGETAVDEPAHGD